MIQLANKLGFADGPDFRPIRLLIPIAVIVLAALVGGIQPPIVLIVALLVLPLGIRFGLHAIFDPTLAILALIPVSMFVTFEVGTGSGTSINSAILLLSLIAALWFLGVILKKTEFRLHHAPSTQAMLIFIVTAVIGFISGQIPWFSFAEPASLAAQFGGLMVFVFSALVFFLMANRLNSAESLYHLTLIFFVCGALYMLMRLVPSLAFTRRYFTYRIDTSMLWVWLISLGTAQIIWNKQMAPWLRGLVALFVGATLYIAVIKTNYWLSGWMPPLAGLALLAVVIRPKLGIIFSLLGLALVFVQFESVSAQVQAMFGINTALLDENSYSLVTRVEAWRIMFEIIGVNPLTGVGIANYYFYTPLYEILGYNVQFNSHSQYIDFLAQIGIVGLVAFMWLMFVLTKLILQLIPVVKTPFERAYLYGSLAGLFGTVVAGLFGDWVVPFVYNLGVAGFRSSMFAWLFLGGVVAIYRFNDIEEH